MWIRVCRYKNAGVAGYAEAFIPVQSDSQTSEWYSYFENDVLSLQCLFIQCQDILPNGLPGIYRNVSAFHGILCHLRKILICNPCVR